MDGLDRVLTERLELRRPRGDDLDQVHALHADPAAWEHLPSGRHAPVQRTRVQPARWQQGWDDVGLGSWVARGRVGDEADRLPGVGGCDVRHDVAWNLGYRFVPRARGRGLAQELVAAARAAAARVRPDLPVVAQLLEHNRGSRRTAERAGLRPVWRGADAGVPDPTAVRLVDADRPVPQEALALLVRS